MISSSNFPLAQLDRNSDWKTIFDTLDNNFSKISEYLATLGNRVKIESFSAQADQTVFTLSDSYNTTKNCLAVYRNGSRQWLGQGFTETSETSFTLTEPCEEGDEVIAVYNQYYIVNDVFPLDQLILKSPNGTQYKLSVDDSGQLSTELITDSYT